MTDATVGFLLENLKQVLIYNADLIGGVQDNVKELCEDLDTLRGFVKEYTRKQHNNEILKALVKEIRTVVNEAEDAVESFIVEESIHENRNFFHKAAHVFDHPFKIRSVAKQIEAIREKVRYIYQNKAKYGLEVLHEEMQNRGPETKKFLVVEEDNVVGFEDQAKELIGLLTGESLELEVISVVGMPGMGKSTLAKKISNDPRMEYEFNTRAFIFVSEQFDRREVFLNMLGALTELTPEMHMMSDDMLAEAIRIQLKGRRYFYVMDDVWTKDAWDEIKIAFPNNNKSSRILITTPNRNVALHANPISNPYELKGLNFDERRKLLRMRVFGANTCPEELEDYEFRIVEKCGGVPQSIVVIAGILLNHRDRTSWWKKVAESVTEYISRDQEQSTDVIALSYNHLPFHLKPCFLYLGVFREDFEIPVWKLLRLWIAEGFIEPDGEASLEDRAEEYLEDLVDRDLVIMVQRKTDGKIKTCRLRKTLRELCRREALEEGLFHEIKRFENYSSFSQPSLNNDRRLCINYNFSEYIHSKPSGVHVRSLLSFAKEESNFDPDLSFIPEAFKLLRVVDIESVSFTTFPDELCNLVLLKYLAISGDFEILPEEMSNLWNIQTLILETSARTLHIEADLWKLLQLRHFYTKASANLPANTLTGKDIRPNLQTLSRISPESCQRDIFERLPRLKKLGIRGKLALVMDGRGECNLFDYLFKLEFLENLKLINDDAYSKLYVLPDENRFPAKLTKLTLFNTKLDWRHISTLGRLDYLEVLKLKENAFEGDIWQTEDGGFRRLNVLLLGKTNLLTWKASANSFPRLRTLIIRNCDRLHAVPSGLAEIASLQAIELYYNNPSVASSARKIQILKLQLEAQEGSKISGFKLSVYPPDQ